MYHTVLSDSGGPAARAGRGGPVAGGRGAARGGGMSGMSARGGASAPLGRGRGGAASAPSMLQPSYGSESYEYVSWFYSFDDQFLSFSALFSFLVLIVVKL
jgi:hypothetical protein